MKKFFGVILISLITLTSCGRSGPLEYVGGNKKPEFSDISDEMTKKAPARKATTNKQDRQQSN